MHHQTNATSARSRPLRANERDARADVTLPALRARYAAGEVPADVVPQVLENARAMPETFLSVIELQVVLDSCSLISLIPETKRCVLLLGARQSLVLPVPSVQHRQQTPNGNAGTGL